MIRKMGSFLDLACEIPSMQHARTHTHTHTETHIWQKSIHNVMDAFQTLLYFEAMQVLLYFIPILYYVDVM